MEHSLYIILRVSAVYSFLFLLFRLIGARTLAESTPFDVVLLLIISEATQQAMIQNDSSLSTAFIAVLTLAGLDYLLTLLRVRVPWVEKLLEQPPKLLFKDGKLNKITLRREHILECDILASARENCGIDSFDQIDTATLESNGRISIKPRE